MKINKEDIKKLAKILMKLPYDPVLYKSYIYFPIEIEEEKDEGGVVLLTKNNNVGSNADLLPGLTLDYVKKNEHLELRVCLAYANTGYAPKFSILDYIEYIQNDKLSKGDKLELGTYECLLVNKQNVQELYELNIK